MPTDPEDDEEEETEDEEEEEATNKNKDDDDDDDEEDDEDEGDGYSSRTSGRQRRSVPSSSIGPGTERSGRKRADDAKTYQRADVA